jgi:hypothetical protein
MLIVGEQMRLHGILKRSRSLVEQGLCQSPRLAGLPEC